MNSDSSHQLAGERLRIGIVIQGPLRSRGLNGKTWGMPISDLSEDLTPEFDAVWSIEENARQIPEDVIVVVATWANEPDHLREKLAGIKGISSILSLEDPSRHFALTPGPHSNNHYRQFWSTLQGIKELESECTHVLKIRSDQALDIENLLSEFRQMLSQNPHHFFTPIFRSDQPFWLTDFFFGANIDLMTRLLEDLCKDGGEFLSNTQDVHSTLFRYFQKICLGDKELTSRRKMFSNLPRLMKTWSNISLASGSLTRSLVWRGERIQTQGVEKTYHFGDSSNPWKHPTNRELVHAFLYFLLSRVVE